MTKREICERLIKIYALAGDGLNAELVVCDAIRGLLLDLAAPEKEETDDKLYERLLGGKNPAENKTDDEPNLTYAVKDFLRRYFKEHGDMNTVCDQCKMAHCCDSSVHEVCQTLQKEESNANH